MTRLVTVPALVVVICVSWFVTSAVAQTAARVPSVVKAAAAVATGELRGTVTDEANRPVAGAVVSALGTTSAFAVTDAAGRFGFAALPPGPYLVRAYLNGYTPVQSSLVQVNGGARLSHPIKMTHRGASQLLEAGVAGDAAPADDVSDAANGTATADDHSELAWRLRHLKRGALDDAEVGTPGVNDASLLADSPGPLGRAMSASARLASAVFSELPLSGQLNLLTTTSFNRPQDLLSLNEGPPHGVAYLSLLAPTSNGDWTMRGALTQGDLASWVLAGSYVRHAASAHAYEAGLSYTMQRYVGGNAVALAAVPDGSRNAGTVYGYDNWRIIPAVTLTYGARYARYDYLETGGLLSPRLAAAVDAGHHLRLRAAASRRQLAPGAEEFLPPSSLGVWLPPERTFSSLTPSAGFRPEQVEHYELAAEQLLHGGLSVGVRTFQQRVDDQLVTVFGMSLPHSPFSNVGHYFVGSAGDINTQGWSVSVSRAIVGRVHGAVDYTESRAVWSHRSPEFEALSQVASSFMRTDRERLRDLTTSVDAEIPLTATRMFVLYRLNANASPTQGTGAAPQPLGSRFDVQIHQELPFLNFTNAQWAMLVAIRNVFREDAVDASVYDELLVIRPPTRIVGGVTVRF